MSVLFFPVFHCIRNSSSPKVIQGRVLRVHQRTLIRY